MEGLEERPVAAFRSLGELERHSLGEHLVEHHSLEVEGHSQEGRQILLEVAHLESIGIDKDYHHPLEKRELGYSQ